MWLELPVASEVLQRLNLPIFLTIAGGLGVGQAIGELDKLDPPPRTRAEALNRPSKKVDSATRGQSS